MDLKDPILEQYEKIKQAKEREQKRADRVPFSANNYLNTRVADGESIKKLTIRVLQLTPDSKSPFKPVALHYYPATRQTFICAKETPNLPEDVDTRCPFCELREEASRMQQGAEPAEWNRLKEVYKNNGYNTQYILRVIDRGDEASGVKFWRVTQPIYEMLISIYSLNKEDDIDIFDYDEGKDLVVTIQKQNGKNRITSIQAKNKTTPLANSEELKQEYVNDTKLWNDVYGIKAYDYLSILLEGGEPYYNKETNMWVDKKEIEEQKSVDEETERSFDYEHEVESDSDSSGELDDLPF